MNNVMQYAVRAGGWEWLSMSVGGAFMGVDECVGVCGGW